MTKAKSSPVFSSDIQSSLTQLDVAVKEAKNMKLPPKPGKKPAFRPLPVEPNLRATAEDLGTCPHELEAILKRCYNTENEMVRKAIANLVMVVKMTDAVELGPTRKKVKDHQIDFDNKLKWWHEEVAHYDIVSENRIETILKAEQHYLDKWAELMTALKKRLSENRKLSSLAKEDRWLILSMKDYSGKLVRLTKKKEVTLYVKNCLKLKSEDIFFIRDKVKKYPEIERQRKLLDKVAKIPEDRLIDYLFISDNSEARAAIWRRLYQEVIMKWNRTGENFDDAIEDVVRLGCQAGVDEAEWQREKSQQRRYGRHRFSVSF